MNAVATIALAVLTAANPREPTTDEFKPCVEKGLKWLAAQQHADGSWASRNDRYPTTTTTLAGLALLAEGSTPQSGTYAHQLRKAVAWIDKNATESGLLATSTGETGRNVQGHAHALLFLACAHETDDDPECRKQIGKLLSRAVAFAEDSQGNRGGWGLVSSRERANGDDSFTTLLMLQGLFAARKAGIAVPPKLTDAATNYLVKATNAAGGVFPRAIDANFPGAGTGQVQLTSGSAATLLMHDGLRPDALRRWVANLKPNIGLRLTRVNSASAFTNLQIARAAFALGENGHARLDPNALVTDLVRWSSYRAVAYGALKTEQSADGSWPDTLNGPAHSTAIALIILQLENDYVPAFAR